MQSEEVPELLNAFSKRPEYYIVSGADHFWGGYEDQLTPQVGRYFLEKLK